jgi:hypothetical protein
MSLVAVSKSDPWFRQASSDVRTAEALLLCPSPMQEHDIGCHVAALCAQAIEKSLKGYLILNGQTPALNHRPDKYLERPILTIEQLRYRGHYAALSKLFHAGNKAAIRRLFDLTPGGKGHNRTDVANTEYPWSQADHFSPVGASAFADIHALSEWIKVAKQVSNTLLKLWTAVQHAKPLM